MTTHRVASILGVPIDDVTMDETIDLIAEMVEEGRASGRVHQIATVNVDFLCNAVDDERLMGILGRTALSIADGMPLVWGSRWLGTPLRERVAGADLVPALVERAAADGYRVYFFGAAPTVAAAAADVLRERYPGAEIVADAGPMFADPADMDPAALVPIKAARPDICCIALGNPKQELWIERFGADVGAPVVIGVGGTLDFVSGAKRRAPGWAQRFGFEWVHRAVDRTAPADPALREGSCRFRSSVGPAGLGDATLAPGRVGAARCRSRRWGRHAPHRRPVAGARRRRMA